MTEENILIETSLEQNQPYWSDTEKLLEDNDPRVKNYGAVNLLVGMTPELLEENYKAYEEGFNLTLKALSLEDTDTYIYYPVRVCAVCTLANVLEQIQKNPKIEYAGIYAEAALAIEDKAYDKKEHPRVRFPAREAVRKYLKGDGKKIFK
jgi:hypothetical protein